MLSPAAKMTGSAPLRTFRAITSTMRQLHCTAMLLRNGRDYRKYDPCPADKYGGCRNLNKRPCSPTDPPVRPCDEEDCIEPPRYPCCVSKRISMDPCFEPGVKLKPEPFVSMWETNRDGRPEELWHYPEECCPKCEEDRFDVLHYTPSKMCRNYQRTWSECPMKVVPKRVCCWHDAKPPPIERRKIPLCPRSACTPDDEKSRMICLSGQECPRFKMPCCRAARIPPNCQIPRTINCERFKCPFPSFSECLQEDPADLHDVPAECRCLKKPTLCEQYAYLRRLEKRNCRKAS